MVVCSSYLPIGRLEGLGNIAICGNAFVTAWHVHSLTLTFKKLQKQFVCPLLGLGLLSDVSVSVTSLLNIYSSLVFILQIMSVYCLPNIPIIHVAAFFNKLRSRVS